MTREELVIDELSIRIGSRTLLDRVSLTLQRGETVGLVGESGSGKSLTARVLLGLLPAGCDVSGVVGRRSEGLEDLVGLEESQVSMIFQDPRSSLNPVRRIGDFLHEGFSAGRAMSRGEKAERSLALLEQVGLGGDPSILRRYPHQLSGGMLQRVVIASAMLAEPHFLVSDESTTALDVTTQAEVVSVLQEQQRLRDIGVLFITHDLGLASAICDRVLVMKQGRVVESGDAETVLTDPRTEYTRMLVEAHEDPFGERARDGE